MQSITIILAALLSVIATVDGSHQDLNSNAEQRLASGEQANYLLSYHLCRPAI